MSIHNDELSWKGYAIKDTSKWSDFEVIDFPPKEFGEYDVDIKVDYCGVCASDVHTITGGWGPPKLPVIPGHEVVGTVHRVGPKVTEFNVGDRVGVGAQIGSCLQCADCKSDNEQYCEHAVDTYNSQYPNGDLTYGGYASAIRAHERYVFAVPKEIPSNIAAPMMCAGITVYSPLKRNGCGKGKVVGIVGVGGLGHLAIQFAHAMGAEVVVFSHSANKREEAEKLGADHFVVTSDDSFVKTWDRRLDLVLSTVDVSVGLPMTANVPLAWVLRARGVFIAVGLPDDAMPSFNAQEIALKGLFIGGSKIGSKAEIKEMLQLAATHNIRTVIQELPMKDCGTAVQHVKDGKVRFRHVLKMDL